jgi:hypothetical protein
MMNEEKAAIAFVRIVSLLNSSFFIAPSTGRIISKRLREGHVFDKFGITGRNHECHTIEPKT